MAIFGCVAFYDVHIDCHRPGVGGYIGRGLYGNRDRLDHDGRRGAFGYSISDIWFSSDAAQRILDLKSTIYLSYCRWGLEIADRI